VVDAYTRAQVADPGNIDVESAYVRRMVELNVPELAEAQARDVVTRNPADGLARAVVGYMAATRGQSGRPLRRFVHFLQFVEILDDFLQLVQRFLGDRQRLLDLQRGGERFLDLLEGLLQDRLLQRLAAYDLRLDDLVLFFRFLGPRLRDLHVQSRFLLADADRDDPDDRLLPPLRGLRFRLRFRLIDDIALDRLLFRDEGRHVVQLHGDQRPRRGEGDRRRDGLP